MKLQMPLPTSLPAELHTSHRSFLLPLRDHAIRTVHSAGWVRGVKIRWVGAPASPGWAPVMKRGRSGPWLTLLLPDGPQSTHAISSSTFLVGRGEDNHLRLRGKLISRTHLAIRCVDGVHTLEDTGSSNGSWLAGMGQRLAVGVTHVLRDGDRLLLGGPVPGGDVTVITFHESQQHDGVQPSKPRSHAAAAALASDPAVGDASGSDGDSEEDEALRAFFSGLPEQGVADPSAHTPSPSIPQPRPAAAAALAAIAIAEPPAEAPASSSRPCVERAPGVALAPSTEPPPMPVPVPMQIALSPVVPPPSAEPPPSSEPPPPHPAHSAQYAYSANSGRWEAAEAAAASRPTRGGGPESASNSAHPAAVVACAPSLLEQGFVRKPREQQGTRQQQAASSVRANWLEGADGGQLASRWGAPPFSVLDARKGYWKERRAYWEQRYQIRSGEGRKDNLIGYKGLGSDGARGTSIFCPVRRSHPRIRASAPAPAPESAPAPPAGLCALPRLRDAGAL